MTHCCEAAPANADAVAPEPKQKKTRELKTEILPLDVLTPSINSKARHVVSGEP